MRPLKAGPIAAVCVLWANTAYAGVIGPTCPTCHNTSWELTYTVDDPLGLMYTFTLTATAGVGPLDYSYIDNVAIKVASDNSQYEGVQTLTFAPGGTAAWNPLVLGGLNAGGCSGGPNAGFACATAVGSGAAGIDLVNSWTFQINLIDTGVLLTDMSIKARFTDAAGNKVGALLSEDITQVSEPSSLLLLSTGIVALTVGRRRLKR